MTGAEIVAAMMWDRLAVIGVVFVTLLLLVLVTARVLRSDRRR
jgi:hypothetical protein